MSQEKVVDFVTLNEYPDYEILSQYPFTIRRKDNHYVVKEFTNKSNGYVCVCVNGNKQVRKHRLIANQFIPNPDNLPMIDHLNRDRTDYHLSNLRWVSVSDNSRNKSSNKGVSYEFIDDIPDDAIVITHYDLRNERRYFGENKYYYNYNDDIFYERITNEIYRIMHVNTLKGGRKCIMTRDINNKQTTFYIHTFKHQYGLE